MNDLDVGTNFRDAETDKELAHFMGNFDLPRVGDQVSLYDYGSKVAMLRVVVSVSWSFAFASSDGSTPIIGRCVRLKLV